MAKKMKIELELPRWGDELYYIEFDEKDKRVLIRKGSLVGVCLSFCETIFQLYDSHEQKDVSSNWCFSSFADAEKAREVFQKDFDEHNLWGNVIWD